MISKPKEGWDREHQVIEAARQFGGVATKTLSAGKSGMVRLRAGYAAIIAGIMALMLGWAALAAGFIGGNIPTLVGAGSCSALLGWLALHNARKAFGPTSPAGTEPDQQIYAANFATPQPARATANTQEHAADMPIPATQAAICYDRKRLCMLAARLLLACALMAWVLTRGTHRSPLMGLLILAVLGFGLWRSATLLLRATDKDLTAISWDNHQILVRTFSASRQVPWPSVESLTATRRVRRLWGLIPVATSHNLVFQLRDNGARRKMIVSATVLTIRPEEAEALLRKIVLQHARVAEKIVGAPNIVNKVMATQPDFSARETGAAQARAFEPNDRPTVAPPVFGRKVAS